MANGSKSPAKQRNLSGRSRSRASWTPLIPIPIFAALAVVLTVALGYSASPELLSRAKSNHVCMMTDKIFPVAQIPVPIDGKTYYGCCSMCAGKLAHDPGLRQAIDPVSGRKVDKADAVIGASKEGEVFYFESEKNLTAFHKP